MHLIVANIPEGFHSPDLRNFFSEFVEKKAFSCFHFRHRPQSHLLDVLKYSLSTSSSPRDKQTRGAAEPRHEIDFLVSIEENEEIRSRSESGSSSLQPRELKDKGFKCPETPCSSRINNEEKEGKGVGENEDTESKNEASKDVTKETSGEVKHRTHWLNSGLAGLASLIKEKKEKARPIGKLSQGKEVPSALEGVKDIKGNDGVREESSKGINGVGKGSDVSDVTKEQDLASPVEVESLLLEEEEEKAKRMCCVVEVKEGLEEAFVRMYNRKHWLTRSGDVLPQRCHLLRADFRASSQANADGDYRTRQQISALTLVSGSPQELLEFRPPPIMPQGNVGTPTHHFRELIRTCQMPSGLIKKLGLDMTRGRRKRRFGQVPFDYGTSVAAGQEDRKGQREADIAFTATGHLIPSSADFEEQQKRRRRKERRKKTLLKGPRMELEEEKEDGAEVEEWERYEPFHEDVTSQDRIKERRFEEELEVVWEKGGSGLVFYTDAQFWRAQQGDFDEQTADEWDVDMSVYYEEGAGDKDARDGVEMINSDKLRSGKLTASAFARRKKETEVSTGGKRGRERRKIGPSRPPTIGRFEAHTRGFGRRMMEAQGWREGEGLGAGSAGMPYALEGDGQHPHDRKGFGYHGEKLQGWMSTTSTTTTSSRNPPHHRISTVFDREEDADPPPPPLRTPEPTVLTHHRR